MEVDIDVNIETLERFVKGLTGGDAGSITIEDIECEEIIRMEDGGDEDSKQTGSSGNEDDSDEGTVDEEEEVLRVEEAKFIADGDLGNLDGRDDEETDGLSEDDDDEEGGRRRWTRTTLKIIVSMLS